MKRGNLKSGAHDKQWNPVKLHWFKQVTILDKPQLKIINFSDQIVKGIIFFEISTNLENLS